MLLFVLRELLLETHKINWLELSDLARKLIEPRHRLLFSDSSPLNEVRSTSVMPVLRAYCRFFRISTYGPSMVMAITTGLVTSRPLTRSIVAIFSARLGITVR